LLAKNSLAECRENPDAWKQVYAERITRLITEAEEVKKTLDEELVQITKSATRAIK
jgi:hypothetical protein